jgi:hypothetical protein
MAPTPALTEVSLTAANMKSLHATLGSLNTFDVDWKAVMDKTGVTKAGNA